MHRKNYISFLSEISDLTSAESEFSSLRADTSYHRPIRLALGLASLVICAASVVVGATNPSGTSDRGASRARVVSAKSSAVEPAASALFNYTWNVNNRQFPLLSFFSEHLNPGLDQSLSYPMDQFRFLILETLDYDDARVRYFLPSASGEGKGVHFIEFESTGIENNFVSIDEKKLKLIDDGVQKIIRASDGTRYVFVRYPDGEFRCADIKDSANNHLNFIYTSNGSTLHGVVDSVGRTITFNYVDDGIASITQTWTANAHGLQKTWIVGDQSAGASLPLNYPTATRFVSFKKVPGNALVQQYTPEMVASDRILAQIFGAPNAVAAGNGFEPAGLADSYPRYRGDIIGDDGRVRRGHLSYAVHLYGNSNGTGDSPLYIPNGFTMHSALPSPTDAAVTFYYPKLGNLTNVTLAVFHVAGFEIRPENDRVRIGNIGGMGGSSPLYKHSHIEFYRGNTGLPPAEARMRLRIDPAAVFATTMRAKG